MICLTYVNWKRLQQRMLASLWKITSFISEGWAKRHVPDPKSLCLKLQTVLQSEWPAVSSQNIEHIKLSWLLYLEQRKLHYYRHNYLDIGSHKSICVAFQVWAEDASLPFGRSLGELPCWASVNIKKADYLAKIAFGFAGCRLAAVFPVLPLIRLKFHNSGIYISNWWTFKTIGQGTSVKPHFWWQS